MSAVAHEPRLALEGESPHELSLVNCAAHHNWRDSGACAVTKQSPCCVLNREYRV